jgi:hypothetical protein
MNLKTKIAAITVLGIAVAVCSNQPASAQAPVLDELYGQGVHYYFANRIPEARQSLTAAIDQGSKDPRCYYFRGLCSLRYGDTGGAEKDFHQGGTLEAKGRDRIYPVGRSLQRIQGRGRLVLERHRNGARIAARVAAIQAQQARYEEMKRAEEAVIRDPNRKPTAPPRALPGPAPAADPTDPFAAEEAAPRPAPPIPPETPPVAPVPAEASPTPAPVPAPSTDPAPADDDPFSAPATDDDPFSAPAPALAPAADPPPAEDDPFGDPFDG